MTVQKQGPKKALCVGFALLALLLLLCFFELSPQTRAQTTAIAGLSEPFEIAVTPNGTYAYVTNAGTGSVWVINMSTNEVVKELHHCSLLDSSHPTL